MDVMALCPLPVGIVWSRAPRRTMTVIVKATYSIDRDGEARLAERQEPLALDQPSEISGVEELRQASDFAPWKPRADVLLVGHAWPPSPSTRVDARLAVHDMSKRFVALAAAPSASIPLVSRYLRAHDGRPERVGPLAPWSPERAELARRGGIGPDGLPAASAPRVDFDYYNAAPPDQQIEGLPRAVAFTLEGLVRRGARRRVELPGARAKVFCARREEVPFEVPLTCDTLWIDTDREICALTWRGLVVVGRSEDEPLRLIVALEPTGAAMTWHSVRAELDRALHTRAAEPACAAAPGQTGEAPPEPPPAPSVPRFGPIPMRLLSGSHVLGAADHDARLIRPPPPSAPPSSAPFPSAPFPSAPPSSAPLPSAPPPGSGAWIDDEPTSGYVAPAAPASAASPLSSRGPSTAPPPAVPRAPSPWPPALPFRPEGAARDQDEELTGLLDIEQISQRPVLPFRPPDPPPSSPILDCLPEPSRPITASRGAEVVADTERPAAAAGPELLAHERYASIKAEIWEGRAALDEVLARHGIDEIEWRAGELRLAEALAREAREARCDLALALAGALEAARERLADPAEALRTLEDYLAVQQEIDASPDPRAVLAARGLSAAEWRRMQRRWRQRAMIDGSAPRST